MKTIIPLLVALIAHTQLVAQTRATTTLYNASETCVNEFNNHLPTTQLGHEYLFKLYAPEQNSQECFLIKQLSEIYGRIVSVNTTKNKREYIITLQPNLHPTDLLQYLKSKNIFGEYYTTTGLVIQLDVNNKPFENNIVKK